MTKEGHAALAHKPLLCSSIPLQVEDYTTLLYLLPHCPSVAIANVRYVGGGELSNVVHVPLLHLSIGVLECSAMMDDAGQLKEDISAPHLQFSKIVLKGCGTLLASAEYEGLIAICDAFQGTRAAAHVQGLRLMHVMHCTPSLSAMRAAFPSITCLEVNDCAMRVLSILAEAVVAFSLCSLVICDNFSAVLKAEGAECALAACRAAIVPLQLHLKVCAVKACVDALAAQCVEESGGRVTIV